MKRRLVFVVAVGAALSTACAPSNRRAAGGVVRVAAASDLRFALDELSRRFEAGRNVRVQASFGSSGAFFSQLLNEAPFDVFLSADVDYARQLAARHLTAEGSEFVYGVGRLVVWVPTASSVNIAAAGVRAAADPAVRQVAIANPQHAPYGRAAVAAMRSAGVYAAVQPKLVFGENVEQALQFAHTGNADLAVVALSLALAPPVRREGRYREIPLDSYPQILQGGVILRWAIDLDAARAFRDFIVGADGRAVLKSFGFFLPES